MTFRRFGVWLAVAGLPGTGHGASPSIERGSQIYDICGTCHGPRAEGNESLSAPPLAGQQASYLLRQLQHFRSGVRQGTGDVQAREMLGILNTVSKIEDWQAVIAYVETDLPQPNRACKQVRW